MEARHRAAGDGDEQEREQAARPHRAGAVDEPGHGRHLQFGRRRTRCRSPERMMVPILRKVER